MVLVKSKPRSTTPRRKKNAVVAEQELEQSEEEEEEEAKTTQKEVIRLDNLPKTKHEIETIMHEVVKNKVLLWLVFFEENDETIKQNSTLFIDSNDKSTTPIDQSSLVLTKDEQFVSKQLWCIPVSVDVKKFNFDQLVKSQTKFSGQLFDVITMDPPWVLSTNKAVRGVKTNYSTVVDHDIENNIPFDKLQKDGFLFIWVINNKYRFALGLFAKYGYKLVDELVWVK